MQYTNWLRWGILAGAFLVPFVIFVAPAPGVSVFGNMFFPYITGKNFLFRIIVELMLLGWVILALKEPKYRPRASWLMWAALAFVAWMAIATALSVDPIKSFWSNFERMEGYAGLLHLFAWFVVTGAVLGAERLWERFFNVSIAASAVTGFYALLQVTHLFGFEPTSQSGARADTTFGNATYLAVYLLVMLFLTLYMLLRRRESTLWQALYGIAIVLQLVGLYFTETRGAILGVLIGLFGAAAYVALFAREREWAPLRKLCVGVLVGLAVLAAGFFALKDTALVKSSSTLNRLANISLEDRTTIARFQIWGMAAEGIKEKPLTGWGQENFNYVFNKNYDPAMWDQEQWFDRAHNQFIDWFVAGGAPAGLLYVLLYALAVWGIIRAVALSVPERAVLLGLLAGFAFNNLLVFDNLVSGIYFFTLLAFVHSLTRRELPANLALTRPMSEHGIAIAAPVVAIVILGGAWAFNAPAITRAKVLVDAMQTQTASGPRDPAHNAAAFERALGTTAWPSTGLGYQETVEQLAQYASNMGARNASPQTLQEVHALADGALASLAETRPGDARLELFYGSYLASSGQYARAFEHLDKARELSPRKQQILIQLGILALQAGSATDAVGYFRQAHELAPEYDFARIMYAAGYYYAGQQASGDALITDRWGSVLVDNPQLLTVYMDTKQYSRAAAIWQMRIDKDPQNADLLLGLAQVHFAAGDMASTIATLEKIIAIAPAQAAQIQQVINQIKSGALKP